MIEFQRQTPLHNSLNIAPLIDIIFLLLLFFILTSVFAKPGIPVELPASAAAGLQDDNGEIQLSLSATGDIGLNGHTIAMHELPAALTALFQETQRPVVAVNVDRRAPFEQFVTLIDTAKAAGGETLLIVTEVPLEK